MVRLPIFIGACLAAIITTVWLDMTDARDCFFFVKGCGFGLFLHWVQS